jgi:hypothetical protein
MECTIFTNFSSNMGRYTHRVEVKAEYHYDAQLSRAPLWNEIKDWCRESINFDDWDCETMHKELELSKQIFYIFYFRYKEDAFRFKMIWG